MGGVDSQARATLLLVESKKCGAGRNKTYDSPSSEQYTVFGLTPTTVVANKPPPLPFPTNNRRIKKVRPRSAARGRSWPSRHPGAIASAVEHSSCVERKSNSRGLSGIFILHARAAGSVRRLDHQSGDLELRLIPNTGRADCAADGQKCGEAEGRPSPSQFVRLRVSCRRLEANGWPRALASIRSLALIRGGGGGSLPLGPSQFATTCFAEVEQSPAASVAVTSPDK